MFLDLPVEIIYKIFRHTDDSTLRNLRKITQLKLYFHEIDKILNNGLSTERNYRRYNINHYLRYCFIEQIIEDHSIIHMQIGVWGELKARAHEFVMVYTGMVERSIKKLNYQISIDTLLFTYKKVLNERVVLESNSYEKIKHYYGNKFMDIALNIDLFNEIQRHKFLLDT